MARCTQKRRHICVDLCQGAVDPADTMVYDRAQGRPIAAPPGIAAKGLRASVRPVDEADERGGVRPGVPGKGRLGTPIDSILESWQSGALPTRRRRRTTCWKPDGASSIGANAPIDAVLDA